MCDFIAIHESNFYDELDECKEYIVLSNNSIVKARYRTKDDKFILANNVEITIDDLYLNIVYDNARMFKILYVDLTKPWCVYERDRLLSLIKEEFIKLHERLRL